MGIPERAVRAEGTVPGWRGETLRRLALWLVVVAYACAIFYISSLSGTLDLQYSFPHADKVVHFLGFALLSFLLRYAIQGSISSSIASTSYVLSVVIAASYGASDEVHQAFVPGRTASIADWIADAAGPAIFQGSFYLHARRRRRGFL